MNLLFKLLPLLCCSLLWYSPCAAQAAGPADPCPMVHEAGNQSYGKAFARFQMELRTALAHQDAAALGFLVEFPLTVNMNAGAILIPNAASLQGHLQTVFPPAIRAKILASQSDDEICKWDGFGLANRTLWLSAAKGRWLISTVNAEGSTRDAGSPALVYSCETGTHRIVVAETAAKTLQYRSWNKPKPLSDVPNLELVRGEMTFQGSGICAYPTYIFVRGEVTIAVDKGLGCTDGREPRKATGHLTVTIAGKIVTDTYCF